MCGMRRVLRNAECLLVPEPRGEAHGAILVVAFLFNAGCLAVAGVGGALGATNRGFPVDGPVTLFFAAVFLVLAGLFGLSSHRRRARLGLRVVLTLSGPAFAVWFLIAAPLLLAFFCSNYFCNRRRVRR